MWTSTNLYYKPGLAYPKPNPFLHSASLIRSPKLPFCSSCGAMLEGGEKFCDVCGSPIEGSIVLEEPEIKMSQQDARSPPTRSNTGTEERLIGRWEMMWNEPKSGSTIESLEEAERAATPMGARKFRVHYGELRLTSRRLLFFEATKTAGLLVKKPVAYDEASEPSVVVQLTDISSVSVIEGTSTAGAFVIIMGLTGAAVFGVYGGRGHARADGEAARDIISRAVTDIRTGVSVSTEPGLSRPAQA